MTEEEREYYQQIRNVPSDKILLAAKVAMSMDAKQRFHAENEARMASIARVNPVHEAMRAVIANSPEFRGVKEALVAARRRPPKLVLAKPIIPAAPKVPRLRLGSVHLVDTPPFQAMTWQDIQLYGGTLENNPPLPVADGTTGNMSFSINGGGWNFDNNSSVSCWCAIGQTYVVPGEFSHDATLTFSANPTFIWGANWSSLYYRLASGNIWIGQVVYQYDQSGSYVSTPVSYQHSLWSWNDYNLDDDGFNGGNNTSFGGLTTVVHVQRGFSYSAWVWIGATAYGDWVDWLGPSWSVAVMNANVSTLVFDTV